MTINIQKLKEDPYIYASNLTIPNLVKLLKKLSESYYTSDPIVSDDIYDTIKELLDKKDPTNKYLQTVGYDITDDRSKVLLPYALFSLDKVKDLDSWTGYKTYPGPYLISDKLDGISALLYKDKKILKMYTRGDSQHGQDISHLIPYVFKNYDFTKLPEKCAIRGELVISKVNYDKVKDKYLDHRSCIAGLVNSKKDSLLKDDNKATLANLTDFVGYELIEPRYKQYIQLEHLEKWLIPTVTYIIKEQITNESLKTYLTLRRNKGKYYIDGLVITDCSKVYDLPKDSNPKYAFAFKHVFDDQIMETTVRHIEWNITKNSLIKPVLILNPVKINGITVTRVTGNNAKFVMDQQIGPGTVIKIIRSGDVIPKVVEVIRNKVVSGQLPNVPYKWSDTGADIISTDTSKTTSNIIVIKKITFFFETVGVKWLGKGIVEKLVLAGYDSITSILKAKISELSKINGLGLGVLTKIFESIREQFEIVDLPTLMAASGLMGKNMGKHRIDAIVQVMPDILKEKADKNLVEKIKKIDGFSNITAEQFVGGLDQFREFFKLLEKIDTISVGHIVEDKVKKKDEKPLLFEGKKFALTGKRDKEIIEFITENDGIVKDTVNSETFMLLSDSDVDSGSNKFINAKKFNIKIMTYTNFKKEYKI